MKNAQARPFCGMLLPYLKPHFFRIIIVFAALVVVAGSILFLGQALKQIIDMGLSSGNLLNLNKVFFALIFLVVILSIASFTRSSNINIICEQVELAIKRDVFRHIIKLSPEFYESCKTSDIISRLTNDLSVINSIISTSLSSALRNFIMMLGGVIFLLITNLKLTAYVLLLTPIALAPIIILGRKIKVYSRQNQDMVGAISAKIEESINNVKTIQSFCHEKYEASHFAQMANDLFSFAKKRIAMRALMSGVVIFIVLASIAFVLWIGGMDVIKGRMSAGALSSFIYYSVMVAASFGGLSDVFGDLQRAKASAERVVELLEYKSNIGDGKLINPKFAGNNIVFNNVTLRYPSRPGKCSLKEFSAEFNEGQSIALVGRSGAGKTTIFELMQRFYEASSGNITLGGIDIKDLKLHDLRSKIAIVPQDPVIFSMTALENIKFGREKASFEEVVQAAKVAEIYDFIMGLPQGFDTYLGEKGVRISGGQKQRIAIARAVLKDPKILLLDEATSALDSESEQLVLKALSAISKNRTTITIAHRLSTVKAADKIILLDLGRIVDVGTHEQLYRSSALYKSLWDRQSANE